MKRPARLLLLLLLPAFPVLAGDHFYKNPNGLFSTRPGTEKSIQTISRFGPVGIGIDLVQPAFTMQIHNVEEGSPAAATGKLDKGQFIQSINGQKLADIDPRIQLGKLLAEAEATDGVVKLMISDQPDGPATEVVVKIPVLGAYSETWPLDCPKSEKIVENFAAYLSKPDSHKGFSDIGMLVLLGSGEDRHLGTVRDWARGIKGASTYAWHLGYGGIPLCEYYLRTGDRQVLPTIQAWVDSAVAGQVLDGWAGRGGIAGVNYGGGGGHLNAGGTAVVTFLLLAKECGAEVPDDAMLGALRHFFRYSGRGLNPYGDGRPEASFVDNGKNGNLAFAMAAAAALDPGGEDSIYAAARDHLAMNGFYTTTYMLHGHTGGGIGEIWRSAAMGLLHEKRPKQYRGFMDHRQWHYDLSRRWDGSFAILGGARYDNVEWGAGYALAYVIPRQKLRVAGAPPTPYSKPYELPERPWGTAEDDLFQSLEGADDEAGTPYDTSDETLARDSGKSLIDRLAAMEEISDELLQRYVRHPDFLIRRLAANHAAGLQPDYMRKIGGAPVRLGLLKAWIRSDDPRVRASALEAMGFLDPREALTRDVFDRLISMLRDPEESWWVKDKALLLIGSAPKEFIVPQVDLLVSFLKHDEWWLRNAALTALAPVVADGRCYERVVPAIGELVRTNQRWNVTSPLRWGPLRDNLGTAGPEVRKLATAALREAYSGYGGVTVTEAGLDITGNYDSHMEFIAQTLATVPGGYDVLYEIARQRHPKDPLPYDSIFLSADPEKFSPRLREAIGPIIREKLIYEYIGRNYRRLMPEVEATRQSAFVTGVLDGLVDLYRKVGVDDYEWRPFGPDLYDAGWSFHTFDPPEKQKHDVSPWRYREVTYPQGMENWSAPDFDPAGAGWKTGRLPIGQYQGKILTDSQPCGSPGCRHSDPMRSFWEKEVLLVRGTFEFPKLKEGHLYRIRVGNGQHVGSGDGYKIYINGKPLVETESGVGRRAGGKPRGGFITREFIEEFNQGPVTIAATSFLRYGGKAIVTNPPVPQGIFSLWVEEMKLPPVDAGALRKSATVIPMLTSEWQDQQDPEAGEIPGGGKYLHDGGFKANPEAVGDWAAVTVVEDFDDFDPEAPASPRGVPFRSLRLTDGGLTDSETMIWSGDMLMDLDRYEALKMRVESLADTDYLVLETGRFSEKNPAGWKCPLLVMKRP